VFVEEAGTRFHRVSNAAVVLLDKHPSFVQFGHFIRNGPGSFRAVTSCRRLMRISPRSNVDDKEEDPAIEVSESWTKGSCSALDQHR
jgi:hypothetical protein